jgi:hypothetical protein
MHASLKIIKTLLYSYSALHVSYDELESVPDKSSDFSLHHHVRIVLGPNQTLVR